MVLMKKRAANVSHSLQGVSCPRQEVFLGWFSLALTTPGNKQWIGKSMSFRTRQVRGVSSRVYATLEINDCKLPEQCSETVQCVNEKACYWRAQKPLRRGSDKSGIQCLGRTSGCARILAESDARGGGAQHSGYPACAQPSHRRPRLPGGRPLAGRGQETSEPRGDSSRLVPQPGGFFFFFFRLPGARHPRPSTAHRHPPPRRFFPSWLWKR